jgi:hypothetical protein
MRKIYISIIVMLSLVILVLLLTETAPIFYINDGIYMNIRYPEHYEYYAYIEWGIIVSCATAICFVARRMKKMKNSPGGG